MTVLKFAENISIFANIVIDKRGRIYFILVMFYETKTMEYCPEKLP